MDVMKNRKIEKKILEIIMLDHTTIHKWSYTHKNVRELGYMHVEDQQWATFVWMWWKLLQF